MKKIILLIALGFFSINSFSQEKGDKKKRPSLDEMFVEMDTNEDLKLSIEEVKGPLKESFTEIDIDKDGFLTKEEIEKAPKPERKGPPKGQD